MVNHPHLPTGFGGRGGLGGRGLPAERENIDNFST